METLIEAGKNLEFSLHYTKVNPVRVQGNSLHKIQTLLDADFKNDRAQLIRVNDGDLIIAFDKQETLDSFKNLDFETRKYGLALERKTLPPAKNTKPDIRRFKLNFKGIKNTPSNIDLLNDMFGRNLLSVEDATLKVSGDKVLQLTFVKAPIQLHRYIIQRQHQPKNLLVFESPDEKTHPVIYFSHVPGTECTKCRERGHEAYFCPLSKEDLKSFIDTYYENGFEAVDHDRWQEARKKKRGPQKSSNPILPPKNLDPRSDPPPFSQEPLRPNRILALDQPSSDLPQGSDSLPQQEKEQTEVPLKGPSPKQPDNEVPQPSSQKPKKKTKNDLSSTSPTFPPQVETKREMTVPNQSPPPQVLMILRSPSKTPTTEKPLTEEFYPLADPDSGVRNLLNKGVVAWFPFKKITSPQLGKFYPGSPVSLRIEVDTGLLYWIINFTDGETILVHEDLVLLESEVKTKGRELLKEKFPETLDSDGNISRANLEIWQGKK